MRDLKKINFVHNKADVNQITKEKYQLSIPVGAALKVIKSDGEPYIEKQFLYPDSSVIYLTNFGVGLNERNIENAGLMGKKKVFLISKNKDTLVLEGNVKGLYWKEISMGELSLGYIHVNGEKKKVFDRSLNTIRLKRSRKVI